MDKARSRYRPGYEIVAERILDHIEHEGLLPGARLPTEREIATTLGVSHTVAREAVKILTARGHLITRKRAGIFVAERTEKMSHEFWDTMLLDNLDHAQSLFECRQVVEQETARLAAIRATPLETRTIRQAAAQTVAAARQGDVAAFIAADETFHRAIGDAAHNAFLGSIVERLTLLKRRVIAVGLGQDAVTAIRRGAAEHHALAIAIVDGRAEAAMAAIREHIGRSANDYKKAVQHRLFDPPSIP